MSSTNALGGHNYLNATRGFMSWFWTVDHKRLGRHQFHFQIRMSLQLAK